MTERQRCESLKAQLDNNLSPMRSWFTDLGTYFAPYRPRFTISQNLADRRSNVVLDGTPFQALEIFSAGLAAYVSPAESDWFDLTTEDPELMENPEVAEWCADSTERLRLRVLKSNTYQALPMTYEDLGAFGTAALFIADDDREVFRCYPFAVGTYGIGQSANHEIDTFGREFEMTARQLVEMFGKENVSRDVLQAISNKQTEQKFTVEHLIYPNREYMRGSTFSTKKKFAEVYWEIGSSDATKFLMRGGYDEFPLAIPRWSVAPEDLWGVGPGMYALGDCKSLQAMERDSLKALAKMVDPPVVGGPSLGQMPINLMPGGKTIESVDQGRQGLRAVHEVNVPFEQLEQKMDRIRARINAHLHVNLFMQIAQDTRLQPKTAAEVNLRFQELARVLAKPLNRLTQDLLKPLINRQFGIMARRRMFAPAPEILRKQPLRVEFTSALAAAQRGVGTSNIERYLAFAAAVSQVFPDSKDKTDSDQMMDEYAKTLGLPEKIIRSDDETLERRAAEAAAEAQAQQAENIPALAGAAKDLAKAPLDTDNALSRLIGGGTPQ